MGLLDNFDAEKLMTNPLLNVGLGIMANSYGPRGQNPLGAALGRGAMMGMQTTQEARQSQLVEQMRKMQMDQMQEAAKQKQAQQLALQSAPDDVRQAVAMGVPYSEIWKNQNQAYNLGQGEKRFVGNKVVAEGAPKTPEWATIGPDGQMQVNPLYLDMKKQIAAAGRANNEVKVFNNTKDDFKNERDLRNDFAGLPTTKAFNEVQSAYDQIQVAIKKESPAGDLAAATKIMKILDPGSVVRESELGMAMAATGAMDRLQNYAEMTLKGTKLTPKQRQDFGALASQLYTAAADRYDASANEYQSVAKDYNLNPSRVAKTSQRASFKNQEAPSAVRRYNPATGRIE